MSFYLIEYVSTRDALARLREALWEDFKASVESPSATTTVAQPPPKMVKIEKRYRFAGEEVK